MSSLSVCLSICLSVTTVTVPDGWTSPYQNLHVVLFFNGNGHRGVCVKLFIGVPKRGAHLMPKNEKLSFTIAIAITNAGSFRLVTYTRKYRICSVAIYGSATSWHSTCHNRRFYMYVHTLGDSECHPGCLPGRPIGSWRSGGRNRHQALPEFYRQHLQVGRNPIIAFLPVRTPM